MSAVLETRTGGCMCGAVRFEADLTRTDFGACHCEMCRRWAGSAFLGINVPATNLRWTGAQNIRLFQSSDWAERGNCARCGSALFYHVTLAGEMTLGYELAIGLLDDASGLSFDNEIYIDCKPDSFAYQGDRPRLTRKQTLEKFGIEDKDELS